MDKRIYLPKKYQQWF